jgi:hypothetical protein
MAQRRLAQLLLGAMLSVCCSGPALAAAGYQTRNVILVTLDGVRVQEMFAGLDETIAAHDTQQVYSEIATQRQRYGGASPRERRQALLPVFWNRLAPLGIVLGNAAHGNVVKVENQVLWSTPGYTELMTGRPRPEVVDNDHVRHDHRTALQLARQKLGLGHEQVAQFGSWEGFKLAAASNDDAFLMIGVYDALPPGLSSPQLDLLAGLRRQVMGLWEEGSNDVLTFRMAMSYLQAQQPRVLWLALVNSDDWAHADRYDRYLEYLHLADSLLGELWETLQSMDAYRDRTTLIVTTDHGRGRQASDWAEHDLSIPGSDDIWIAVIGPDTPDVGEATTAAVAYQGQVAATLLQFLGIDYHELDVQARPPLAAAVALP